MKKGIVIVFLSISNYVFSQIDSAYYNEAIEFLSNDSLFRAYTKCFYSNKQQKHNAFSDTMFKNNNGITNNLSINIIKPRLILLKKISDEELNLLDSMKANFKELYLFNASSLKKVKRGITVYYGNVYKDYLLLDIRYTIGNYYGINCTDEKSNKILVVLKFNKQKKVINSIIENYKYSNRCRVLD